MEKPPGHGRQWRLVGVVAEGTFCHKPCTVSGGGKSEISKPITDAILTGPVFVADLKRDFDRVAEIDSPRLFGSFHGQAARGQTRRCWRRNARSARSSNCSRWTTHEFTPDYNAWLETVPQYIKELVFVVKRYYKPAWDDNWREPFHRGHHQRRFRQRIEMRQPQAGHDAICAWALIPTALWRTFGLRKDFHPAAKVQEEDDITASVLVPRGATWKTCRTRTKCRSLKFVEELRTAFVPAARTTRFIAAMTSRRNRILRSPTISFPTTNRCTQKWRAELVEDAHPDFTSSPNRCRRSSAMLPKTGEPDFFVSSAHPRLVNGKPSKNPRYLQKRPDLDAANGNLSSRKSARACAGGFLSNQAVPHAGQRRAARPPQ